MGLPEITKVTWNLCIIWNRQEDIFVNLNEDWF